VWKIYTYIYSKSPKYLFIDNIDNNNSSLFLTAFKKNINNFNKFLILFYIKISIHKENKILENIKLLLINT